MTRSYLQDKQFSPFKNERNALGFLINKNKQVSSILFLALDKN